MRRRELLGALAGASLGSLAGCSGLLERRRVGNPPVAEYRPDAVYIPTHVEGMKTVGVDSSGAYRCALTYTYPHRFWLVTGRRRKKVEIRPDDSVHLMPIVWDAETGLVPPDINPSLTVRRGGETVTELSPWPMLSQPMGFHFGDNVQLGGEGTYRVAVSLGAPSTRRTGVLADNRGEASFGFEFEFRRSTLREIPFRDIPEEREGSKGALDPMEMDALPSTRVPAESALSGTVRGTADSGDARFVVTTLGAAERFDAGDGTYLAVSPRTPYNRYMLPLMSLSARLSRGDETVFEGVLQSTIDPDLHYHYGAVVPGVESGDRLSITVDAPPQAARHEGYETAFLEMDETTVEF